MPSVKKAESCKTREKSLTGLPQNCFFEGKQYDLNRIKMPANESSAESMNGEVEEIDLPSSIVTESCKTREKRLAGLSQSCFFEGKQYDLNRIKLPANESSVESMNGEVEEIDLPSVKKAESCKTREKRLADLPQNCSFEGKQYG